VVFVPGAEAYFLKGVDYRTSGQSAPAVVEFARLMKMHPDVMQFRSELAYSLSMGNDWHNAYLVAKPLAAAGVRDFAGFLTYALGAASERRVDEAIGPLRECLTRYSFAANEVHLALGAVCDVKAMASVQAGRLAEADALLTEAETLLVRLPAPANPQQEADRRKRLALAWGLQADILAFMKNCEKAGTLYRKAAALAPEMPGAEAWARRAEDPCRKAGSGGLFPSGARGK
jgi:tetratricopeptide (TPR) repeat protein